MLLVATIVLFSGFWLNVEGQCQTPDKESGVCISVQYCKTVSDFLSAQKRPLSKEIVKKLESYQCGVAGTRPKVCCPQKPITVKEEKDNEDTSKETLDFPDVSKHPNLKLLPDVCGIVDTVDKIVGGEKAALFEFPWMALLSYRSSTSGVSFKCGGTIINKNYILTAAHCVTNLGKFGEKFTLVGVRVGEYDIRTTKDCEEDESGETCAPPHQDLSIQKVLIHQQYNTMSQANDIALIRVSSIKYNENCKPVCLPLGAAAHYNYTNRKAVVTGWGYTEANRPSPILLKAAVPVVTQVSCMQSYKRFNISNRQICAGGDLKSDSCGGDSGGPLHSLTVVEGEPRYVQQGVVSFGPRDCGKLPLPGVYTRVASYLDWILDKMMK